MKIERYETKAMTIEEFAEKNNLTMVIHKEDESIGYLPEYIAHFKDVKVGLFQFQGNGKTEEEAIANYARNISFWRVVLHPETKDECEIEVPRLITRKNAKKISINAKDAKGWLSKNEGRMDFSLF